MEAAFGWLGDLMRAVMSLFPRILIVRKTHAGVKFAMGSRVRVMHPGLHWVFPLLDEYEVVPVERQTANLDGQYLVTLDGRTIAVGGIVVYRVSCVESLLTNTWDYEDTINDFAMAAIKSVVTSHVMGDLLGPGVDDQLRDRLAASLDHYGVEVIEFTLSDCSPCIVLANWGG